MDNLIPVYSAEQFAFAIIVTGIIFTVFWYKDHLTHKKIWETEIDDGELRTHRMIFYASYGILLSTPFLASYPIIAIPIFFSCWITRLVHEGIDEFHWHLPRCTERETVLHLVMWISVHIGEALVFAWGAVYKFEGFMELHTAYHFHVVGVHCNELGRLP